MIIALNIEVIIAERHWIIKNKTHLDVGIYAHLCAKRKRKKGHHFFMRDSETEMPWLCLYTKIRADPFLNHRTKVCSKVRAKDVCKCFQGFLKGQAAFWPT